MLEALSISPGIQRIRATQKTDCSYIYIWNLPKRHNTQKALRRQGSEIIHFKVKETGLERSNTLLKLEFLRCIIVDCLRKLVFYVGKYSLHFSENLRNKQCHPILHSQLNDSYWMKHPQAHISFNYRTCAGILVFSKHLRTAYQSEFISLNVK